MSRKSMPVKNWMTEKVIVAEKDSKFTTVRDFFLTHNIHHLPVVDGRKVIGIISSQDILKAYNEVSKEHVSVADAVMDSQWPVEKLMTANPTVVGPDDELTAAVTFMRQNKFKAVPVCENENIVGILTNNDVVKYAKLMLED